MHAGALQDQVVVVPLLNALVVEIEAALAQVDVQIVGTGILRRR